MLHFAYSPSAEAAFLPLSGEGSNAGFSEQAVARFELQGQTPCKFFVDDIELPGETKGGATTWLWTPGFYAGSVVAELVPATSSSTQRFLLDVAPHREKLGQPAFNAMVGEVWATAPALILGTEPAKREIGKRGRTGHPAVRLARLMAYARDFTRALLALRSDPHRQTIPARTLVQPPKCRRIDRHTIRVALRLAGLGGLGYAKRDDVAAARNIVLDVPISIETSDTPANRTLLAFVDLLRAMTRALLKDLERQVENEVEETTKTSLAIRWPRRRAFLEGFLAALEDARRSPPLSHVSRSEITASGLVALSAHPQYARASTLASTMLRPGHEGQTTAEKSWMSPTWGVYEAWCFVRLRNLLAETLPALSWRDRSLPGCDACFQGSNGKTTISLYFQLRFPAGGHVDREFASISAEFRPDIVLAIESPSGLRWMALDAKYRVSRSSVLEGMGSSHLYHDALRLRGVKPALSLLLVPGTPTGVDWLLSSSFQALHGVGVEILTFDRPMPEWLQSWLQAAVQT